MDHKRVVTVTTNSNNITNNGKKENSDGNETPCKDSDVESNSECKSNYRRKLDLKTILHMAQRSYRRCSFIKEKY